MTAIVLVLLVVAAVLFALVAFDVVDRPSNRLIAAGLLCWVLVPVVHTLKALL